MLKLLDGATIRRDTKTRIEMFLVYVDQALGDGKPRNQSKWRSIMGKLERRQLNFRAALNTIMVKAPDTTTTAHAAG